MFLETIQDILDEENVGTTGVDLFLYEAPADVQNYVLVKQGGDGIPIDWDLPNYYNVRYQIIVRNIDYVSGNTVCQSILNALSIFELTKNGIYIKYSLPREQPKVFRRSDSGVVEFSINFDIVFVKL